MSQKLVRLLLVVLLALGTGALVACGSDDSSSKSSSSSNSTSTSSSKKKIRIAMVTDIGGLNDRGFNALAYEGLQQAKTDLGADIRVLTSKSNADYVPNLSTLARQKYDLVIGVGFLMGDAMAKVAKSFPQTNFAIIDFPSGALKGKPKNVHGLLFKENEAGYLVGTMAGLYVKKQGGKQVVSAVGGQKVPAVDSYAAGYEAGAKKANPGVKTLFAYSQDFVDQAKCKEIALNQIGQGSQVVFAIAGELVYRCVCGYLPSSVGMSVISPEAIWSWTFLTSASNGWPAAETVPMPTPPDLMSKMVSVPGLNFPSWTSLAVSNAATSTFLSADVITLALT